MTSFSASAKLFLLGLAAMTRTILTYDDVFALTGLPTDSAKALGYVYFYCAQHKLPLRRTISLVLNCMTK
jgi:hypothetical protein